MPIYLIGLESSVCRSTQLNQLTEHNDDMNATTTLIEQIQLATRYVDANKLLELLFDEASRPSLRWLRDQQKARSIEFVKIGRRIFFDPIRVKSQLDARAMAKVRAA
jgi:hypothetical protein